MKFMKKLSAVIAAVGTSLTVSAPCTASEVYLRDNDKPLYDVKPSKAGCVYYDGRDMYYLLDKNHENAKGVVYAYPYKDGTNSETITRRMMSFDKETGIFKEYYTGFTKSSSGRKYYRNGFRAYGWTKINGYWYHFDPYSGRAASGKTKIGNGVYTFTKSGKWTGAVSKEGKLPSDFSIRIDNNEYALEFDNSKETTILTYHYSHDTHSEDNDVFSQKIEISKDDMQVLYSIVTEFGFEDDVYITEEYIRNAMTEYTGKEYDEPFEYWSNGEETKYARYSAGRKNIALKLNEHSSRITYFDKTALLAERTLNSLMDYLRDIGNNNPAPDYVVFWYPE